MSDTDPAYVLREPECGCATIIMVDSPIAQKDNAREIAKGLRQGMTVERVTVAEARALWHSCAHWRFPKNKRTRTDAPIEAAVPA